MRWFEQIAGLPSTSVIARRAQAMCAVLAGLAPASVLTWSLVVGALATERASSALVAVGVFAVLVGAGWTTWFAALSDSFGQRARDLHAAAVLAQLERGDAPPPFTLYLRPFATTNEIEDQVLAPLVAGRWLAVFGGISVRYEFEQQIERAVRRFAPLVALGRPLEHVGAGRIEVRADQWQAAAALLMAHAQLIVLLPSARRGTRWELEHLLATDAVPRTVVVDPPLNAGRYVQRDEWTGVRRAFEQRGYLLPPDDAVGRFLFFGESRTPILSEALDLDEEGRIRRFFRTVLSLRQISRGEG